MNKRITEAFANGKAFIPFVTCGDPSLEVTEQLVYAMEEAGADLIELGIPFSDPTAEGPVIQEANVRALSGGVTTDFGFDDVVRDAWGFCSRNGVVFVKTGEQYQLLNSSGVQIGENYEAVSPFISKNPAAVQQAGKWGFVSSEGEKVLDCMFEKARSFSAIGYAAVQSDESWGFIKSNGDLW